MADGVERMHGFVLDSLQEAGFEGAVVQGRSGPDHAGVDVFLVPNNYYDENFEHADICATWRSNGDDAPWLEAKIRYGERNVAMLPVVARAILEGAQSKGFPKPDWKF